MQQLIEKPVSREVVDISLLLMVPDCPLHEMSINEVSSW